VEVILKKYFAKHLMFLFFAALIANCGDKKDSSPATTSELIKTSGEVGLYKSTSEYLTSHNTPYFIITANKDLYLLKKDQARFERDYQGKLDFMEHSLKDDKFETGLVAGTKMAGDETELSDDLKLLCIINGLGSKLVEQLNPAGISVEVRLQNRYLLFSKNQAAILQKLTSEKDALIAFLKKIGAKELWITDFTNEVAVLKAGTFDIPGAIKEDADKFVRQIKDQTLSFDKF
jgi:hypothetical protein